MQEKQQQIQQLESKMKEERKARIRAEDRYSVYQQAFCCSAVFNM